MKKLILVLSLIVITACSSSNDDDTKDTKKAYFNPPSWIIGTWKSNIGATFTFTKDNVIYEFQGSSTLYNDQANMLKTNGLNVSVTETKTDTNYNFIYKFSEDSSFTYNFNKLSGSQIESTGAFSGIYTKQ